MPASPAQPLQRWLLPRLAAVLLACAAVAAAAALVWNWVTESSDEDQARAAVQTELAARRQRLAEGVDLLAWQLAAQTTAAPALPAREDIDWMLWLDADQQPLANRNAPADAAAALATLSSADQRHDGLLWLEQGPNLVALAAVAPSTMRRGTRLLAGQRLDGRRLAELGRDSGVDFALRPLAEAGRDPWRSADTLGVEIVIADDPPGQQGEAMPILLAGLLFAGLSLLALCWLPGRRPYAGLARLARLAAPGNGERQAEWTPTGIAELDLLGQRLSALAAEAGNQRHALDYVANHDALTGLGNRRYLLERLAQALNRLPGQPQARASLLLLDLRGIGAINDGLGHATGDAALCEATRRLRATRVDGHPLARIGGNTFAALLHGQDIEAAARSFAAFRAALSEPLSLDGRSLHLDAFGGAAEGAAGMSANDWIRRADIALRAAREQPRSHFADFQPARQADAARRLRQGDALTRGDVTVVFQPLVDGGNGQALGIEALARWSFHGEPAAPEEFLDIAVRSGMLATLAPAIMQAACAALARLRERHPGLRCGLNLSLPQLLAHDIAAELDAALDAAGLPAQALWLELPATALDLPADALVALHHLAERGVELWLDEVGAVPLALAALPGFPARALKIDAALTQALDRGEERVLRHLHRLGRDLDLHMVATGVESDSQRQRLCAIGCPAMQGLLFAEPMTEASLAAWLEHRVVRA